ncbi:MAG TPA: cytochrome c oxidase assembly protein [Candidatus Saccharimonadaceae bacterium]|nr:cytochrome c oxidase assembly protein [Candidatus Saccharimonadaceae bacterium]
MPSGSTTQTLTPVPHAPAAAPAFAVALVALALAAFVAPARADVTFANSDSVYLVGEFVDPVCLFQHNMHGLSAKQCAMVRGRVEQGMGFLDIRRRQFFTVVGQNHWQDPRAGFLDALGETLAIKARVWSRDGANAIVVNGVYPMDRQPPVRFAWWPWHLEWSVPLGCALLALFYSLAVTRWRAALGGDAPFEPWRALSFGASLVVALGSLSGPLHDLSDQYLFSTHMIQHLLLAQVFPPLFLLGLPRWLARWLTTRPWAKGAWRWASAVPVGFALYTLVFTVWHVPALYDLMMRAHPFHIAMHLMVMATAVLMWWPVAGGSAVEKPLSAPAQIFYLAVIGIPMMPVAALITFATQPLYEWYALAPRVFADLSAVDDQRLGGLIMWVPGTIYWVIPITVIYFRHAERETRSDDPLAIPSTP